MIDWWTSQTELGYLTKKRKKKTLRRLIQLLLMACAWERGEKQREGCAVVLFPKYWHQSITHTSETSKQRRAHQIACTIQCPRHIADRENRTGKQLTIKNIHRHNKTDAQFDGFSFCPSFKLSVLTFFFPPIFGPTLYLLLFISSHLSSFLALCRESIVLIFVLLRPWEAVKVEQSENSKQPCGTTENKMGPLCHRLVVIGLVVSALSVFCAPCWIDMQIMAQPRHNFQRAAKWVMQKSSFRLQMTQPPAT